MVHESHCYVFLLSVIEHVLVFCFRTHYVVERLGLSFSFSVVFFYDNVEGILGLSCSCAHFTLILV